MWNLAVEIRELGGVWLHSGWYVVTVPIWYSTSLLLPALHVSTLNVGSLIRTPCCLYTLPTPIPLYLNVRYLKHTPCHLYTLLTFLHTLILSYSAWADTLSYVAPPPPLPATLTGDWGKSVHNVVFQCNNAARQSKGCKVFKCIDGQTMRRTVMTHIVGSRSSHILQQCLSNCKHSAITHLYLSRLEHEGLAGLSYI